MPPSSIPPGASTPAPAHSLALDTPDPDPEQLTPTELRRASRVLRWEAWITMPDPRILAERPWYGTYDAFLRAFVFGRGTLSCVPSIFPQYPVTFEFHSGYLDEQTEGSYEKVSDEKVGGEVGEKGGQNPGEENKAGSEDEGRESTEDEGRESTEDEGRESTEDEGRESTEDEGQESTEDEGRESTEDDDENNSEEDSEEDSEEEDAGVDEEEDAGVDEEEDAGVDEENMTEPWSPDPMDLLRNSRNEGSLRRSRSPLTHPGQAKRRRLRDVTPRRATTTIPFYSPDEISGYTVHSSPVPDTEPEARSASASGGAPGASGGSSAEAAAPQVSYTLVKLYHSTRIPDFVGMLCLVSGLQRIFLLVENKGRPRHYQKDKPLLLLQSFTIAKEQTYQQACHAFAADPTIMCLGVIIGIADFWTYLEWDREQCAPPPTSPDGDYQPSTSSTGTSASTSSTATSASTGSPALMSFTGTAASTSSGPSFESTDAFRAPGKTERLKWLYPFFGEESFIPRCDDNGITWQTCGAMEAIMNRLKDLNKDLWN